MSRSYLWVPLGRLEHRGGGVARAGTELAGPLEHVFEAVRREAAPWRPSRLSAHRVYPDEAALARALARAQLAASPHHRVYRVRLPHRALVFASNGALAVRRHGDDGEGLRRRALLYWLARHACISEWLVAGELLPEACLGRLGCLAGHRGIVTAGA